MSSKSVITAVVLIGLGIIFGVVLVSSFKGVDLSFAREDVKLGAQSAPVKPNATLLALNEAFHEVGKAVTPSVVYIRVISKSSDDSQDDSQRFFHWFNIPQQSPMPEVGAGSGVIINESGYILTNNHVVDNAVKKGIEVTLSDTRKFTGKLVGTDKYTDLAVVKIDAQDLPVASLGNSDEVEVGHIVFAVGNPLELRSTMTEGIVSALGRQLGIITDNNTGLRIEDFIQTDAAVNPGNSGGPLVNVSGEVIGINSAIATTNARYQGYSFAIPINLAKKVATDLIRYGTVRRGYIGVQITPVDAVKAKAVGLPKAEGVFVDGVNDKSAGEEAGLQAGDVILSVDGKPVDSPNALQTTVARKYPGDQITLRIFRDQKTIEKKVVLKALDQAGPVAANDQPIEEESTTNENASSKRVTIDDLGLTVRALDSATKKSTSTEKGVVVEKVEPLGPANERGLSQGDVILSVGSQQVANPEQFQSTIKRLRPGDAVMLRVKGSDKKTKYVAIEMPK
jgi:serine protease Do